MSSPFSITILNAAGVVQGSGPIPNVLSMSDVRTLDGIGSLTFIVPASEPRLRLITAGSQFDAYDKQDGYLGRFLFKSSRINDDAGEAEMQIEAYSSLVELKRQTVGFARTYSVVNVADVIYDLVTLVGNGWITESDPAIGLTSVTYEGESVMIAVDEMRDRWGMHYRLKEGTARTLEFGAFGQTTDLTLVRVKGQIQPGASARTNVAFVDKIQQTQEAEEIYNCIIPVGAGQGINQLDISGAVSGTYTVKAGVNKDLSHFYYIENEASVALYGRRWRILSLPNIRPIENTPEGILNAKNALKSSAEAYIARHLSPNITYKISANGVRRPIPVGDKIRLRYRGGIEGDLPYIDVNDLFYVMDISRSRDVTGRRRQDITIAQVDMRRTSDTDMMTETIHDVRVLKLHVQPQLIWYEKTYYDTIQGYVLPAADYKNRSAEFNLNIDSTITTLDKVKIRFRTKPLITYTLGPNTTLYPGDPMSMQYNVREDDQYPSDVTLWVNGSDVSAQYGGPWNYGELNLPLDVSADITEHIQAAGINNEHLIEVKCGGRYGKLTVAGYPSLSGEIIGDSASHGIVEMNIQVRGQTQAIVEDTT